METPVNNDYTVSCAFTVSPPKPIKKVEVIPKDTVVGQIGGKFGWYDSKLKLEFGTELVVGSAVSRKLIIKNVLQIEVSINIVKRPTQFFEILSPDSFTLSAGFEKEIEIVCIPEKVACITDSVKVVTSFHRCPLSILLTAKCTSNPVRKTLKSQNCNKPKSTFKKPIPTALTVALSPNLGKNTGKKRVDQDQSRLQSSCNNTPRTDCLSLSPPRNVIDLEEKFRSLAMTFTPENKRTKEIIEQKENIDEDSYLSCCSVSYLEGEQVDEGSLIFQEHQLDHEGNENTSDETSNDKNTLVDLSDSRKVMESCIIVREPEEPKNEDAEEQAIHEVQTVVPLDEGADFSGDYAEEIQCMNSVLKSDKFLKYMELVLTLFDNDTCRFVDPIECGNVFSLILRTSSLKVVIPLMQTIFDVKLTDRYAAKEKLLSWLFELDHISSTGFKIDVSVFFKMMFLLAATKGSIDTTLLNQLILHMEPIFHKNDQKKVQSIRSSLNDI